MKASLRKPVGLFLGTMILAFAPSCATSHTGPRHPASSDEDPVAQVPDNQVQGTLINWQVILNSNRLDLIAQAYDCFAYTACVKQSSSLDARMNVMTIQIRSTRPQMLALAARCAKFNLPALQSISERIGEKYQPLVLTSEQLDTATPGIAIPSIVAVPRLTSDQQDTLYRRAQELLWAGKFDLMLNVFTDEFKMDSNGCTIQFDPKLKNKVLTNQLDHTITFPVPPINDNLCTSFRTVRHEFEHSYQTTFANECTNSMNFSGFSQHHERERAAHLNDVLNISHYCERDAGEINYEYRTNFHFLLQYRSDNLDQFSRTATPITGDLVPVPAALHAAPAVAPGSVPILADPAPDETESAPSKKRKRLFFQFWRD